MKYQGKITDPKDLVTKEYVDTGLSGKLGTSGDGSNVTAAFNAASSRTNISTGEKLSVIFGKIAKWFADLGAAAFRSVDSAPTANSTNLVESGGVKSALDAKADQTDLATIHQTSPTCTETNGIAAGVFFYLDNELVVAKTAIANGATFTLNTNYEPPTVGSLNSLRSAIDELTTPSDAHQIRGSGAIYYVVGKTVILSFAGGIALDSNGFVLNNNGTKFQFPSNHLPKRDFYFFIATSGKAGADPYLCEISTSGTIKIYTRTYSNMEYAYGSCSFPIN